MTISESIYPNPCGQTAAIRAAGHRARLPVARAQRGIQCGCLLIGELAGMKSERFHAEKLTAKERKEHKEFRGIAVFPRHSQSACAPMESSSIDDSAED